MENIVNIVNFIRGAEPRRRWIDLVEPVREQIRLMKENHLKGTFLVQYDAMLREDILSLLKPLDPEQFELGIWFEMNQPHVEAAGLKWRGRLRVGLARQRGLLGGLPSGGTREADGRDLREIPRVLRKGRALGRLVDDRRAHAGVYGR